MGVANMKDWIHLSSESSVCTDKYTDDQGDIMSDKNVSRSRNLVDALSRALVILSMVKCERGTANTCIVNPTNQNASRMYTRQMRRDLSCEMRGLTEGDFG